MTFDPAALAAPFPADAVHWRAQSVSGDGKSAMALAYIDARDVMARLDEVCGPANWQDSYAETLKGRLICTLALRINDEWISKSDGAGDTDVEGEKGAISDALKRAAVKWGVGRYLYDMPVTWAECESYEKNGKKHWKKWTDAGLRKLQHARIPEQRTSGQGGDAGPPASVNAMLDGLREAARDGDVAMAAYWKTNWPGVPVEWRQHVLAEKESIKAGMAAVNAVRAG